MKLYLAGAWARKAELAAIAQDLNTLRDIRVEARWLTEPAPKDYNFEFRRQRAQMDVEDVLAADVLVRFTDDLSAPTVPSHLATGARMFETGLAYAVEKKIIVVGGFQPIFDYLPEIIHVADVVALKAVLRNLVTIGDDKSIREILECLS